MKSISNCIFIKYTDGPTVDLTEAIEGIQELRITYNHIISLDDVGLLPRVRIAWRVAREIIRPRMPQAPDSVIEKRGLSMGEVKRIAWRA